MKSILWILAFCCFTITVGAQTLETVLQQGHELAVVGIATSPDSNLVATGSKDKTAKLWELSTGREIRSFLGHEKTVTALAFTGNGQTLITGSNDRTLKWWSVNTGKELRSITTRNIITDLSIDPQQRFVIATGYADASWGDSALVLELSSGKRLASIPVAPDKGLGHGVSVAFSNNGKYVAFGEDNRVANVYTTGDWKPVKKFEFESGWCGGCATQVAFAPDSKTLYLASHNGPMRKFSLPDGQLLKDYGQHERELTSLAVSPNGQWLAHTTEKAVVVFEATTGKKIDSLVAPEKGDFHEAVFDHRGNTLLIASDNNTVIRWNWSARKQEPPLTGLLNQRDAGGLNYDPNFYWQSAIARYVRFKNTLMLARDGKTLFKGKFGTDVRRWELATGKGVLDYKGHNKAVLCYDLSRDGKKMVTGGGDGKIIWWNADTGDTLRVIRSYREPIFDVHFSADETKVLTSSWDATMKIHDLRTGQLETYIDFENNSAYNLLFHPNDLYVFASRLDHSLQMWEIDTRSAVRTFVGHTDVIASLRMSNDQRTLLTAAWDGSIRQWDIGTGLMTSKWRGHQGAVHVAIYHPDGKSVFSGGADRTIRIWDVATGKVTRQLEGHRAEVTSLIISPDQKMLISHSVDGITKFWDLSTGMEFFEHIHLGNREWMAKSPEGYFHGTDQARQYIHFVDGLKTYSVDQFFNDFYRPDLMPKIFQNRGGSGDPKGIQNKLKNSPPPAVKLALLPSVNSAKADLHVKVTDQGGGVQELRIFHNGKNIPLITSNLKLPSGKDQSGSYHQTVDLLSGNNTFSVIAVNRDRVESDPQVKEIFSEHVAKTSVCYVLAVGINQYKNPKMVLNYARPDAQSFSEMLNQKGNALFKSVELHTLYDQEATRVNLLKKLEELAGKIHPEDVFIFYYAGHGSMVDNQFFFIPTESARLYDLASLRSEAVEASALQERLKNIKALKQLIVMDACQSGASVELLATRGAAEEKAIAQLSRSAGIHVMASAGSEQFATEFAELGHGLFTYLLLKALSGEADGAPKDGKVTIYELKSYLDDQVPEVTRKMKGKPQYPYTFSRGHDFPVVLEPER